MTTEEKYKIIKERLQIEDTDVAKMFGYKNAMSFYNGKKGREKTINGIVALFEKVAETQVGFWAFESGEEE